MTYLNNKKLNIPEIKNIKELILFLHKNYNFTYQKDYILKDRITDKIYYSSKILNDIDTINIKTLEIIFKLYGGASNPFTKIFDPIVKPIEGIAKFFLLLLAIILWIIKFAIWIIRFTIYTFSLVYNILTSGIFNAVKYIIYLLIFEPISAIVSLIKKIFSLGIKTTDKDINGLFKQKCFRPKEDGTIPTTILVSTILCPPLGMFMMYGMTGWLKILISTFLTFAYYIPGLIYTLIDFYS